MNDPLSEENVLKAVAKANKEQKDLVDEYRATFTALKESDEKCCGKPEQDMKHPKCFHCLNCGFEKCHMENEYLDKAKEWLGEKANGVQDMRKEQPFVDGALQFAATLDEQAQDKRRECEHEFDDICNKCGEPLCTLDEQAQEKPQYEQDLVRILAHRGWVCSKKPLDEQAQECVACEEYGENVSAVRANGENLHTCHRKEEECKHEFHLVCEKCSLCDGPPKPLKEEELCPCGSGVNESACKEWTKEWAYGSEHTPKPQSKVEPIKPEHIHYVDDRAAIVIIKDKLNELIRALNNQS
jgi:hypothetical protein